MKKLLVILLATGVTFAANAQKIGGGFRGGGVRYISPRVIVAPAYPYYYGGLGYGVGLGLGLGYSPYYNPYYAQREQRSNQLDLQIQDIKNEYDFKISTAKHDKSISKDQRKQEVRDLKHQKEDAIIQAKKDYFQAQDERRYNRDNRPNTYNGNNSNNQSGNNSNNQSN